MSDAKFRYYRLEGDGLEILKAYRAELDALIDDREALEVEFAERVQQQGEYHQAKLRGMWRRMAASVGLDPDNTWGSPEYQIETRFIGDGFGAILYMPRATNPMARLLGDMPVGEEQDPETDIPDEKTTRH